MNYISVKVQVKGKVKKTKQGVSMGGKSWCSIGLENGKGIDYIFVDNLLLNERVVVEGDEVTLNGEMWKDKNNDYKYDFKKMKIVNISNNDIPFN